MDETARTRATAADVVSAALSPRIATRIRDDYEAFTRAPDYPCLGARSALQTGGTELRIYGPMASVETTDALARDLEKFAAAPAGDAAFVALVAMFAEPAPSSEIAFERSLWKQLELLAEVDASPWSNTVSEDPNDPNYAFSFGGMPFFVIGLHPASARLSRRLSWPALVFNPHAQFRRLRATGRFDSMRQAIRRRDIRLQGDVNPNLADAGVVSEARQYSGRKADDAWRCPFHHGDR